MTGGDVVCGREVIGRVPAGALTNGEIVYEVPEANTPGTKVVNGDTTLTQGGKIAA